MKTFEVEISVIEVYLVDVEAETAKEAEALVAEQAKNGIHHTWDNVESGIEVCEAMEMDDPEDEE